MKLVTATWTGPFPTSDAEGKRLAPGESGKFPEAQAQADERLHLPTPKGGK